MGLDIFFYRVHKAEIGYFRKVNFLVRFFYDNCGMNVVDQRPVMVYRSDAEKLLDRCNKVLENHNLAEELLPTMDGFLFGDTNYNENYFANVEEVRDYIKEELLPQYDDLDDEYIEFDIWY